MTKLDKDYIIGGRELDLSVLEDILGDTGLPVADEFDDLVETVDDPSAKMEEVLALTQQIEEVQKYGGFRKWFVPGTVYGIDKLHKHREFLFAGDEYHERYFSAANQCFTGDTLVATPRGPVQIKDISPGDWVYDRYGYPTQVLAVHDNGEKEVFNLVNRKKVWASCTADHEFDAIVLPKKSGKFDLKTNKEKRVKASDLGKGNLVRRVYVESSLGDTHVAEAYTLGAMLGDGCCTMGSSRRVIISSVDNKIPEKICEEVGTTYSKVNSNNYNWNIEWAGSDRYDIWMRGKRAHEKTVDLEDLKTWDRDSLLRFFAGLLDTDGFLTKSNDVVALGFCNQSTTAIDAFEYIALALWQEPLTVATDSRAKYVNGPVHTALTRNPHAVRRICSDLQNVLAHSYKCDLSGTESYGQRSRPEAIKLSLDEFSKRIERVYDITVSHPEHFFLLANGLSVSNCGKTTAAAFELTLHLTGLYPDWWEGRRFTKPISAYAAGSTNETTRNIIQKELIGEVGSLGTGMIPKELILKTTSKTGVSNAVDMLQVKHVSGGTSVLRFKSYDQGRRAFEGEKIDVVWLDELPDQEVYSECYTRTITRNGIIFVTATPLDGMTPLVFSFYSTADVLPTDLPLPSTIEMARQDYQRAKEEAEKKGEKFLSTGNSKAVVVAGWNDAPWLSEEAKTRILAATPPHLRQARSTGIPGDSGGQVFPIAISEITCDDFPIPAHYKLINAIDPGWNFTGAVFGAIDPDTDTLYIYADYKRGQVEPVVHAEAIKSKSKWKDAPCIFDYAGMGGRSEEQQIKVIFRKHGLRLINADKAVNAGLAEVWERMSTGRLKIFKSCKNLLQEIITYRRNERGDIVKENDHCCDPMRYLCVKAKLARTPMMGSGGPLNPYGQLKGNVSGRRYF